MGRSVCISEPSAPRRSGRALYEIMKNVREIERGELVWMQPHLTERSFELRSGEDILGTLTWNSSFGSLADAWAADGHWTFKRTGFFAPRITIRTHQSDTNVGVFVPNWKGEGVLELSDGKCFRWMGLGFWRSHWRFTKSSGEHLIDFEPHSSFLKKTAAVKVTPAGLELPLLSMLILLGWYLMILRSDDDSAAAAAAICS